MRIKWFVSDITACGHVRAEVIAREINEKYSPHTIDCKSTFFLSDYYQTDVMVFQRQYMRSNLSKMMEAQRGGILTVYDLDDDLLHVKSLAASGPDPTVDKVVAFFSRASVQDGVRLFLGQVDMVTVSTWELAKSVAEYCSGPVYVVSNCVDSNAWVPLPDRKPEGFPVIIGWFASKTHRHDAKLLAPHIMRIMDKYPNVRLDLVGFKERPESIGELSRFGERVHSSPWIGIHDLPKVMQGWDIGLAAIEDSQFNRCKSGIKYMQYAALRIPCVASPLPPYLNLLHDGVTGLFAKDHEWFDKLSVLIENEELRRRLGQNAYRHVLSNYDVSVIAPRWIELFSQARSQC